MSRAPSSNGSYDLITLGLVAVDVLIRLPQTIEHDGKQFVEDLVIQGGAPVGSAVSAVGRLGFRCATVAKLGDNTISDIAREQFRRSKVDLGLIVNDPSAQPAIALVQIDPKTAARTVFIQMDHYGYVRPDEVPAHEISKARVLLVDSYDLDATEAALRAAARGPCRAVLDFESGDPDRMKELLAFSDDAILPLATAETLSGEGEPAEVLRVLSGITSARLLVTDGANGSWALDDGQILHQPALPVEAIDTTGCGDAYHAGYVVGLLLGVGLRRRMEIGAWLASIVATRVGGRQALPWRGELEALIRDDLSDGLIQLVKEHRL
jgi:sulfofructose kinase